MRHQNTFPAPRRQPALPDKATAARNQGPAAPNPVRPPLNSAASADETPPETGTLNGLLCAHKTVLGSEEKQHPLSVKTPQNHKIPADKAKLKPVYTVTSPDCPGPGFCSAPGKVRAGRRSRAVCRNDGVGKGDGNQADLGRRRQVRQRQRQRLAGVREAGLGVAPTRPGDRRCAPGAPSRSRRRIPGAPSGRRGVGSGGDVPQQEEDPGARGGRGGPADTA